MLSKFKTLYGSLSEMSRAEIGVFLGEALGESRSPKRRGKKLQSHNHRAGSRRGLEFFPIRGKFGDPGVNFGAKNEIWGAGRSEVAREE